MSEKPAATRKKVKVIGTETYIKQDTGEIKEMQVIDIEERDFNFHKVWLEHIIHSMDLIGNQKTRLAFWIIENLNKENQLVMTQRKIAEKTGISLETVRQTMKALMESDFIVKINSGAYCVNPDKIFKGGKTARMSVLINYHEAKYEAEETTPSPEVKIKKTPKQESKIKKQKIEKITA